MGCRRRTAAALALACGLLAAEGPLGAQIAPGVTPGPSGPAAESGSGASTLNDYPTAARAEFVFACMATNGQTRQALERCACSIDHIASILPYEKYTEAETVLSMVQVAGQMSELFRASAQFRDTVADLRRAQAEAEVVCFP